MTDTIKRYYLYLLKTFGRIELSGCYDLAAVLALYKPSEGLTAAMTNAGTELNKTKIAIEKSCRFYLKHALKEYTIEDLSKYFEYEFSITNTLDRSIPLAVFVPVVKLFLEHHPELLHIKQDVTEE